jgi:hypothetical protein
MKIIFLAQLLFVSFLLAGDLSENRYQNSGLRNPDQSPHPIPAEHPVTGKTINIKDYSVSLADDEKDDREGIEAALAAASPGDEIYFPNGFYNLLSPSTLDKTANIALKSGVNLRGESQSGVIFKTSSDAGAKDKIFFSVMRGQALHDVLLSDFSITSTWDKTFSTSVRVNNPERGGPTVAINIDGANKGKNYNVTLSRLTLEKYSRMAVQLTRGTYDCAIRYCTARNATDLGNGGAGYGFVVQGSTHKNADENPFLGTVQDTCFNLIEHCVGQGPYIRHAFLVQYWAHHNLIVSNSAIETGLDSIDLHGEDEYANEISYNKIEKALQSGIGIGNNGAGHDKTGPWNWIHHNELSGCTHGITAEYGTIQNVIEDNLITGIDEVLKTWGIGLGYVRGFIVRRNLIQANLASDFKGLFFFHNNAEGDEVAGEPSGCLIEGNQFRGNTGSTFKAAVIEKEGEGNSWKTNVAENNSDNTLP